MIILRPYRNFISLWLHDQTEPLQASPELCLNIIRKRSAEEQVVLIHPVGGVLTDRAIVALLSFSTERLWQTVPMLPEWNEISCRMAEDAVSAFPDRSILIAFDDFLFQELPESARKYALPSLFQEDKYLKHGSDGLAHTWAALKNPENGPLITIHLAEHTTLCGFADGKITATSTGYSPVDGLPGEKTCGRIDPSLAMMLAEQVGVSAARDLLTTESGWKALSPSMDILDAALTREMWINELLKSIGSMTAHCGGLERIVLFGENESFIGQTAALLRNRLAGGSASADRFRFLFHALPAGKMYTEIFEKLLNNDYEDSGL